MNVLRLGADGNILFELVFRNLLEALFVERGSSFMNDPAFQKVVTGWLAAGWCGSPRHGTLGMRMATRTGGVANSH